MRISSQIRTLASFRAPYLASTLFALAIVPAKGIGTFAVDKKGRIYVDEDLIGSRWTLEQAAWVMIHEVWHWALNHGDRSQALCAGMTIEKQSEEAQTLNIAADLEINGGMKEAGANLPPDGMFPQDMKLPIHLPMEAYYELLKQKNPPKSSKPKPECGSGAHGQPRAWEIGDSDGQESGDAGRELTETEQELIRDALASSVKDASKTRGSVPMFADRWASDRLAPPKVPWERELKAQISNAVVMLSGASDYTWQKPCRRGSPTGVIMPKLVKPTPEVSCVIDTSGSMSNDMVAQALAEVNGVVRAIGQREVPVICCDATSGQAQRVTSATAVKIKGGGGTDMRIGINAAIEQCPASKIVVVLTDGYTPWPEQMPAGYQLIVALIGSTDVDSVPSFARAIIVE
jgi:predicted metal-dependent peptidase